MFNYNIYSSLCKCKGKRVYDLSKKEFEAAADTWKNDRISAIRNQLKLLGASLDFSREIYTMDERMTEAINEAFIRLHDKGLIYRQSTMVNWCFAMNSTISDVEIKWLSLNKPTQCIFPGYDKKVTVGYMYKFAYPLENGQGELIVATTRPYSLPADVAVAVHPKDSRYSSLIGQRLIHPLTNQPLPIIADERVNPELGTGVVKLTPSASIQDYEMAESHKLPIQQLLDEKGHLFVSNLNKKYSFVNGQNRFEAQNTLIRLYEKLGLYRGKYKHESVIPLCSRTNDLIEYRIMDQWFLNMQEFNQVLRKKLGENELQIVPTGYQNALLDWVKKEKNWCISRQIWWGHQIPAWKATNEKNESTWVSAHNEQEAKDKAQKILLGKITMQQDNDVLDTWFSSALLPFAAFGWPKQTKDLSSFYPLSLIETGFDILKFWIHKMLVLGWYLTEQLPFSVILLHGMIVDAKGKKMSKSVGNVISPTDLVHGASLEKLQKELEDLHAQGYFSKLELAEAKKNQRILFPEGLPKNTADGVRLCMFQYDLKTEVIKLDKGNIKHNRNLINKLWQTFNLFKLFKRSLAEVQSINLNYTPNDLIKHLDQLSSLDQWMVLRVHQLIVQCNQAYKENQFQEVYRAFHDFWLEEFCSIYCEALKPIMYSRDEKAIASLNVMAFAIYQTLLCIHPLVPFVTEELFQRLISIDKPVEEQDYVSVLEHEFPFSLLPENLEKQLQPIARDMELIKSVLNEIRSLKNRLNITKNDHLQINVLANFYLFNKAQAEELLSKLAKISIVRLLAPQGQGEQQLKAVMHEQSLLLRLSKDVTLQVQSDTKSALKMLSEYDKTKSKSSV